MENIIAQTEEFLLKNAWGVIIAGIIASVLGTVLCFIFRKIIEYLRKKFQIRKKRKRTLKYTLGFYRGAIAEYSKYSSYRQVLLVGDYIIDTLYTGLRIMIYLGATCILICISKSIWIDLFLIAICSFIIYPHCMNLKEIERSYKQTYNYIFGEDFTKKCVDGAMETLKKEQDEKKSDIKDSK